MKAIYQQRYGKPDVLITGTLSSPVIKANQVLIRNHASSVNPRDCLLRAGKYQLQFLVRGFPLVLGSDCSGTVVEVGNKVRRFKVGDRVYGMKNPSHGLATYAENVAINEQHICPIPDNMSFEDAAAVPLCALTAWQALFDKAAVQNKEKVLIIGASGGVGSFAVQLAKIGGARVSTVSSSKNSQLVKSLGADEVIYYNQQNLSDIDQQYDVIFDTIGSLSTKQRNQLLKADGRFVTTVPSGAIFKQIVKSAVNNLLGINQQKIKLVMVTPNARQLSFISDYIQQGKLQPVIDQTFTMDNATQAHQRSQSKRACGKIIIRME